MPLSKLGLPRVTVSRRCLTDHQFNTRSRQEDPPNSLYPEFLQICPNPILQVFSHSSPCPGETEYRGGDLKICEQKVRYDSHSGHLLSVPAVDEMRLLEAGKIFHLSRGSMWVNPLPVGWLPSDKRVVSKTSKRYSNTLVRLRSSDGRLAWASSNPPRYPKPHS